MKIRLPIIGGILLCLVCASTGVYAQSEIALETRKAKLLELSEKLQQRDANDRRRVKEFADRAGIPVRRELPNGRVIEFQRFAPGIGPVIYVTYNTDAADTVSTDEVWPGGSAGLSLEGSGFTVGEWDGGAVFATHPDLAGRVTQVDGVTVVSEHATHVAGTLIGAGADPFYPNARGMAYAASLDAYDWNYDSSEMATAAANGMMVSNHSYGIAAGWLYLGDVPPDTWWWIGGADPSDVEDANFGYYDAESQLWDQIAWDAPYYLIVKAAGNDRWDTGPLPGEEYSVVDQDGSYLFTSTLPRNADCAPAGYDCLPTNSVAKNVLTVGAVDDLGNGYAPLAGPAQVQMTGFSGWGPTDDGRIKPDVVGNGMWLVSTWPDAPGFAAALGTSMAAPNVTGSLLLLQEHYEDTHGNGNYMHAATLKALAIHTADESGGNDGPDYEFGWGLLNTQKAAEVITEDGGDHQIIEGSLLNGEVDTFSITVSEQDVIVRVTLVWADPPGTPVPPTLDPPDLMLVNDLDLRLTQGSALWMPWVLDPANPAAAADRRNNFRDNVEQVVARIADTGVYTAKVTHNGNLLNGDPQDYSLIVSVTPAPPTATLSTIDEDFSGGMPAGWKVDTVQGTPWTVEAEANRTGGSGQYATVDNGFTRTLTSLETPVIDLSTATSVVLKFNSAMQFSDWETINLDVSTDGGSNWNNVWWKQGLIGLPQYYVLDLTSHLGGQGNSALRFRYNTFGDPLGYYWQIDNVKLDVVGQGGPPDPGDPPGTAINPHPVDGETGVSLDTELIWSIGSGADSHKVFFGMGSPPALQSDQGGNGFDPGPLEGNTTYYWRIDEVNAAGETTGTEWSFTTEAGPPVDPPGQASGPAPVDGAVGVGVETDLSWTAGSDATSHNVYFGTNNPPAFRTNQVSTSFDPGSLNADTTYYWRIDEMNGGGTTAGSTWSFTTVVPAQDTRIHLSDLEASSIPEARGRWTASVLISVEDALGAPVAGVLAEGTWSDGARGGVSCTTGSGGQCAVQKSSLKSNVTSVTFTLGNLAGVDMVYDAGANTVGEVIVVPQDAPVGNLLPDARDDSFSTTEDIAVSGNVMGNDDPGDAPATVTAYDSSSAQAGSVIMGGDGGFTYTPSSGFTGTDSFGYTITDSDGDSASATVTVTVDPASGGGFTLLASPTRDKGIWYSSLSWSGGLGTGQVTITRNGDPVTDSAANDGEWSEEMGKKASGSYLYRVCENDSGGQCAEDSVQF